MSSNRGSKPGFLLIATVAVLAILVTNLSIKKVSFGSGPTPIVAVITISKDAQGNTIYNPQSVTIKQGEEILILNNDTTSHSFTNGNFPLMLIGDRKAPLR